MNLNGLALTLKNSEPADPWGNVYINKQPQEHGDADLLSYCSGGKLGGKDAATDINNWQ